MTIRGRGLESLLSKAEMNTSQKLLRFIAAAGEKGSLES